MSRDFSNDFCFTKERKIVVILDRQKSQFWMIQKYGLFWSLFSAFFGMFDSPKQRGYPLWEGTENSSQFEAIKLAISDYPEYPLFMCSNSTLFGRPWCNKKPPWIHDSGRVKNHHNWIRNLLDYVGMRPTSAVSGGGRSHVRSGARIVTEVAGRAVLQSNRTSPGDSESSLEVPKVSLFVCIRSVKSPCIPVRQSQSGMEKRTFGQ